MQLCISVGGGQATLTIPGTNIQIPLGPTQPAQQQQQQQQQASQNQTTNQSPQQNAANAQQQAQQAQNQNVNQNQQNQNTNQQQGTVITIPGTNNTIQIPANFAGKMVLKDYLSFTFCDSCVVVHGFPAYIFSFHTFLPLLFLNQIHNHQHTR